MVAKGLAYECVPLISFIDDKTASEWKENLKRISQMLTKLSQSIERQLTRSQL